MSEDYDPEKEEREIKESAQPAGDIEEKLDHVKHAANMARAWKAEYEKLRDGVVADLKEGPRYFISTDDGAKWYAVKQQSEPVEVDMEKLMELVESGEISQEVLEEIAPRKVNKSAFTRACSTKRVSSAQLAYVGYVKETAPYVRFHCYDAG